ncbi:ABC transporter substrate-binding protein [Actinoplanes sp. NPDC051851]|uniref:ABC transporter substrate-binding protein n=1 Tax=Actinoplanes sp. NPDC051851 TaxID=3154753 RepID=UPI0034236ADE
MRTRIAVILAAVAAVSLTGACAAPEEKAAAAAAADPSASAVSGINTGPEQNRIVPAKDETIAARVPAGIRATGKLTIGLGLAGSGSPPLGFTATDNKTLIGSEVDIAYAVAGVLGLEPVPENTSWENLFIGLDSSKYNVGVSNITVTEERKQKYDFATYRLDNLAFAAKKGAGLKVTGPADVAGRTVAVASGTNQEKILVEWSKEAEKQGLKPVTIKYYQTNQAVYLALNSGQIELYLGPSPSVAYQVAVDGGLEVVGTYSGAGATLQGKIALTTQKGDGLVDPLAAAVDKLIETGDYAKILARWNLANEAVAKSEVNPEGLPIEGK